MIITCKDLTKLRAQHAHKKIVLGSGVFDLLHYGHVQYLQAFRQYGDITVVMVKSDLRVRTHKSPDRPIIPETDRVRMVDAIKGVDYVFVGPYDPSAQAVVDTTYEQVFAALQPDVFFSTNKDWKKLENIGTVEVVVAPRFADAAYDSTTAIVQHIKDIPTR